MYCVIKKLKKILFLIAIHTLEFTFSASSKKTPETISSLLIAIGIRMVPYFSFHVL